MRDSLVVSFDYEVRTVVIRNAQKWSENENQAWRLPKLVFRLCRNEEQLIVSPLSQDGASAREPAQKIIAICGEKNFRIRRRIGMKRMMMSNK
jgi:hypothetical protein